MNHSRTISRYAALSEDELAEAARTGDRDAFSVLVERTSVRLRGLISGYGLGAETDDVCQEAYRKAFQAMGTFNPDCSRFFTWLTTIAVRSALDCLKSRARKDVSGLLDEEGCGQGGAPSCGAPAAVDSPEEVFIRNQFCQRMIENIHSLPELYRKVAEYRFIDELPYDEIAGKTSLPLNTVRTRIRRAKGLLIEMMEE